MQLSLCLFNILVLPLVHGQGISSLQPCGMECVNATAISLGCSVNDAKCLCSKANFVSSSFNCAQGTCPPEDLSSTVGVLGELCAAGSTSITRASSTYSSPLTTSSHSSTPTSGPTSTSTPPQPSVTCSPAPSTITVTASSNVQAGTTLGVPPNFLPTSVSESGSSTTVVVATVYRPPPLSGARKGELCWGLIMGAVGVVMGAWSL